MWTQPSARSYVLQEIKFIFCVSKLTGLFPVSFFKDPVAAYEPVDIRVSANITGIICSITMFCVIMGGIISATIWAHIDSSDPGVFVMLALSLPAMLALALVSVIMNATVNRRKLLKLITELLWINEEIRNHSRLRHKKEVKKRFPHLSSLALVVVFVFLCYTLLSFVGRRPLLEHISTHIAKFLGIVTMIQFCKCVNCIKLSLQEIVKIISVHIAEDSTDDRAVPNKNSRKCPTDGDSQRLTAQQMNVYNIREAFPGKIDVPDFIHLDLISYKHSELHSIVFCRKIYSRIYDSVLLINSIYGIPILLEYICDFSGLISSIYIVILNTRKINENINDANITASIISCVGVYLIMLSTILYVSLTCHVAILECKKIREIIEKLLLCHPIKKDLLQELQLFSNQMSNNKIKFMAFWFFVVDIKIFVTFIASAVTYLIVLIQFK
jgi:hypothetical protein